MLRLFEPSRLDGCALNNAAFNIDLVSDLCVLYVFMLVEPPF